MKFTKEQTDFLEKEFNVYIPYNEESPISLKEWITLKDKCFDIEADELLAAGKNNPLTKRGDMAVSIVNMSYND